MDPLEQAEEEARTEGRGGKKKTEEKEEEDVEEEETWTSAEERKLEGLLGKLMNFHVDLNYRMRQSERPSKEILAEVEKEVQEDLEKVKVLIGVGAGKIFEDLPISERLDFFEYCIFSWNEQVQKICQGILEVLINEDTAHEIFILSHKILNWQLGPHLNYIACCNILKWCNDKGACPTIDNIKQLLTRKIFSISEVLFAFLQLMEQLIKTHRNHHGNSDHIEIYLNPMQDLYEVSEDLRLAAGRVIRAAYCTLSNCLESGSLINTLLFLDSGMIDYDDTVIKEWFEKADLKCSLSIEVTYTLFLESVRKFEDKFSRRNDNWLQRSVLHLVAIFVHNDRVLNLIPKEFIEKAKDGRDLHGCTPLHIAYLHDNQSLILLLESYQTNAAADYFGRTPQSFKVPYEYCEDNHTTYCRNITSTESSVFGTMKKMLILPVKECEAIEDNFKILFEMMVSKDETIKATVKMAGSVREKLKVGRFNEVDVQIRMESKPFELYEFPSIAFHEYLVKKMSSVDWSKTSLRPVSAVSVNTPWKFIWEREGSYNGLVISVDVVLNYIDPEDGGQTKQGPQNMNLVVRNAPCHRSLMLLKSNFFLSLVYSQTICLHEWDILDNLPGGCRLGILIAKALLEVMDQVSDNDRAFTKAPITSYVIKNTLFWILAGKTPQYPENVIEERYGHLKQQLDFKGTIPTWTTEEDLERYGEEGRLWAEAIFDAIHFMAKNCGKILSSFLNFGWGATDISPDNVYEVLDTCERCLERLRPCVFFNEKTIN